MKKAVLLIVIIVLTGKLVNAKVDTLTITIQQAIETGLKNRYDIQADKYNLDIASNAVSRTKKEWMPELSGAANIRYSLDLPTTIIEPGVLGNPKEIFCELGTVNNSVFSLDVVQTIYKPGIVADVRLAENSRNLQREKNRQNENLLRQRITESYLNALLRKLQYTISIDNEQRYHEYCTVAEIKFKQGTLIENDYLKAKLDADNADVDSKRTQQKYEMSIDNLKNQMNIPLSSDVVLYDTLGEDLFSANQVPLVQGLANRTEVKQLQIQKDGNTLLLQKAYFNVLPTFQVFANYTEQFQYKNFDYGKNPFWNPFDYVGVMLRLPITNDYKNVNTIREAKYKILKTDLELKQKESDITFQIQNALVELENARQNIRATKSNYDLSKRIYENQKQQYSLGSLLYSSLLDTEKSLSAVEQNYIKAVYDYLVAEISYQKAIGNL